MEQQDIPSPDQIDLVGKLAAEQLGKSSGKLFVPGGYFDEDDDYNIKVIVTGENEAVQKDIDTLTTLYTSLSSNPAALQDERLMKILNKILEMSGISPIDVNTINTTQPNPSLNPANQGGANPMQRGGGQGNVQDFAKNNAKNSVGVPFTPPQMPQ